MMMWWGSPYGGAFGGWGWVMMALVPICLLVVLVAGSLLFAGRFADEHGEANRKLGLDTLHERYARGEISRDEYLEKRRDLNA
jgi:putative membrane protein